MAEAKRSEALDHLVVAVSMLYKEHAALCEEHQVLRDCLCASGVVGAPELRLQRKVRKGFILQLGSVLSVPDAFSAGVSRAVGVSGLARLSCTSRLHSNFFQPELALADQKGLAGQQALATNCALGMQTEGIAQQSPTALLTSSSCKVASQVACGSGRLMSRDRATPQNFVIASPVAINDVLDGIADHVSGSSSYSPESFAPGKPSVVDQECVSKAPRRRHQCSSLGGIAESPSPSRGSSFSFSSTVSAVSLPSSCVATCPASLESVAAVAAAATPAQRSAAFKLATGMVSRGSSCDLRSAQPRAEPEPPSLRETLQGAVVVASLVLCMAGGASARRAAAASHALRSVVEVALPSGGSESLPHIYLVGGQDALRRDVDTVDHFDVRSGRWQPLPQMLSCRSLCSAAVLEGRLYVCGGRSGRKHLDSCERFNPISRQWDKLPSMSRARSGCGVAALCGSIVVVGGNCVIQWGADAQRPATCERYDPSVGRWEPLPSMNVPSTTCVAVAVQDKIYVVPRTGCRLDTSIVERLEILHAKADSRWEPLARRLAPAAYQPSAAVAAAGKLVLVGSRAKEVVYECFDPLAGPSGRWDALRGTCFHSRLIEAGCTAVAAAGKLYIFGALAAESFDIACRRWEALAATPSSRVDCAAASG